MSLRIRNLVIYVEGVSGYLVMVPENNYRKEVVEV